MYSTIQLSSSVSTNKPRSSLITNTFLNYVSTNQYTDSSSDTWTNYVYSNSGSSINAVNFSNYTGTVCVLAIGAGGCGGLGTSSGAGGGGASQVVVSKYELSSFTDTLNINIAAQTVPTSTGTVGIIGANSSIAFSTNTSFNLTSIGGSGGAINTTIPSGTYGCVGGVGRSASALASTANSANYTSGNNQTVGSSTLYAIGYGSDNISNTGFQNASYACSGAGAGGLPTAPTVGTNYGCGGRGIQVPSGYGLSTYYYYCAGGGGSGNTSTAGGNSYGGGGLGCSGTGTTYGSIVSDYTGYGATDNSGTSGTSFQATDSNGLLGSGGGSCRNNSYTQGRGGKGLIIISVKN